MSDLGSPSALSHVAESLGDRAVQQLAGGIRGFGDRPIYAQPSES
ncbi:MAG: hypothetical protein WBA57_04005 [Elainellaceae cyanobacterium]